LSNTRGQPTPQQKTTKLSKTHRPADALPKGHSPGKQEHYLARLAEFLELRICIKISKLNFATN
jgi:hypothetical protein